MLEKKKDLKINHLSFYLKKLREEKQIKYKVSRRKETVKIRAEINEIQNRKLTEKN